MSQEIATVQGGAPVLWEPPKTEQGRQELQSVLLNSTFPGAKAEMVQEVISYCAARQIDPLLKPVHIVPMWNAAAGKTIDTIMPGIYLYRILAARTGEYAGKTYPEWGPVRRENIGGQQVVYPEWCRMKVFRRVNGTICEFGAEEWWLENYAQKGKSAAPNQMWAKRSRGQLAKCVEAQALRMAFPEAFGGTMTVEEMEGKTGASNRDDIVDVEEAPPRKPEPAARPAQKKGLSEEGRKKVEAGAERLIADIESTTFPADLEALTGSGNVRKTRDWLRKNLPELAERVDTAVESQLARFEEAEAMSATDSEMEMPA